MQNVNARRIKTGRGLWQVSVAKGHLARTVYLGPLRGDARACRQTVVTYFAIQRNRTIRLRDRLVRTSGNNRRMVVIDRALPVLVRNINVVDFFAVEGTAVETDLVQHPEIGIGLSLHIAEVEVVARLRREAPKVTLSKQHPVYIELRYPARLIIGQRVMFPHSRIPVSHRYLMAPSRRVY